jgi:hypothetical protein
MQGKKSFILYSDFISVFEHLSDKEAGLLIKHIFKYVNDQNPELDTRTLKIAFEPIKLQLKRDLKDWEDEREARSQAGKKGMAVRWRNHEKITKDNKSQNQDPVINSKRENITKNNKNNTVKNPITNITDTVTVTVTDTVTVNDTKRERIQGFAPPALQDVIFEMSKKLDEFSAMAQGQQFINHYTSNGWMVGKNKMKNWHAAAHGWISRMGNYDVPKVNGKKVDTKKIREDIEKYGDKKISEL